MRIVVIDTAAEYGGAMSILMQFYEYIKDNDKKNEWIFVLSDYYLEPTENIKILVNRFPKKSGVHKIVFDLFTGKNFIRLLKPDLVFSLQNIIIFGLDVPQLVYVHQSIPFQNEKDFSLLKKEERSIAFCQKVIGFFIKKSIIKADGVFVQTEWMKKAVIQHTKVNKTKIRVAFPNVSDYKNMGMPIRRNDFFYPTNNEIYKNIKCIEDACMMLNKDGIEDFAVNLTIENDKYNGKHIRCIGRLNKYEMELKYNSSILIYPSYIETVGLPLIEAMKCNSFIIVADCEYSREVLANYSNVLYFNPWRAEELKSHMEFVMISNDFSIKASNYIFEGKTWDFLYNSILAVENGVWD